MLKHSNNKLIYKDEIKTFKVDDLMKSRSPEIESFVASFPSRSRRFLQVIQPRPKEQLFVVSVSHGQHASALDFLTNDSPCWYAYVIYTTVIVFKKSSSHTQCLWIWIMTFVVTLFSSSFIKIVDLSRICDFSER